MTARLPGRPLGLIGQIVADQIEPALALTPDLVTFSAGGNDVIITGTGFTDVTSVTFGSSPATIASWTDSEIQIKHYMNLGIAAATPRGLMVPNIKDAQELSLRELAIALNNLTTRAREGKTQPAEMANGTLTITNIG